MKLLYALLLLIMVAFVCTLLIITKSPELFKGVYRPIDKTGVPNGEPRIKQLHVNMSDHNTVVTIMHGTLPEYVILVHGYPLSQATWFPLLEDLSIQARNGGKVPTVITYDLRGCGYAIDAPVSVEYLDSDPSNKEWTLELFADDLDHIYTEIVGSRSDSGIRKVSIGGWGFGGCIAQEYALQHPQNIENLYLFSTLGTPALNELSTIQNISNYAINNQHLESMLCIPQNHVTKLLCDWFNVEDAKKCPATKDVINDTDDVAFVIANAILTVASCYSQLQVLKIISSLDLITRWQNTKDISYNVVFVAPINDTVSLPNQVLKIYTAIKNKHIGDKQPTILTPDGKHYYCLQNPSIVMQVICPQCIPLQYKQDSVYRHF